MANVVTLLGSPGDPIDQGLTPGMVGQPVKADGWYGATDGLHTVAIYVSNFSGRVYVEATLAMNPTEADWFPICLDKEKNTPYIQFPVNPAAPTGATEGLVQPGDTGVVGRSFKINAVWIRARMDRTYLDLVAPNPLDSIEAGYGRLQKVVLAR